MSRDNNSSARSRRDIESDLADTRNHIEHTLELLEDHCRPSVLLDQAWRYARSKNQDGTTTRLQETVTRNPLPVVLMGASLAWLLFSGHDGSVPQADSPLAEGTTDDDSPSTGNGTPGDSAATASSTPPGRQTSPDKSSSDSAKVTEKIRPNDG